MDTSKEIYKIVSEIIGISESELDPNASFMDDYGLDSLRALEILAAVENTFGIIINPERLREMTSLVNVIKIVDEYVSA
ncbi:acyl carrier protein [Lutispora saccharofermentans]|uniref:Acyl carrier protein n=1 Tax=Lutispora saccharofermentans TaxID=3024236 RepID=A0ABT1NMH2_9FIRM|nr:acyl carrier protein [Lutispora saccharofermentans]MCQ1531121.1 acyl carrier protein [Lutispora saccharofermentans]